MSCFAVIPWSNDFAQDKMFDPASSINRDYLMEPFSDMKREFEKMGHDIHTIDIYTKFDQIDYFLFFSLDWEIHRKVVEIGKAGRMVYCTAEPPSVYKYNSLGGYRVLRHVFPYILTWNPDWVDGKTVFRRNIPYYFVDLRKGNMPFEEKKLLTSISGNKTSDYPGELYSERKKAIVFFENNHAEDFDFYGMGWDENEHPCYKGAVSSKADIFHKYRFALCYENIEGLRGYVTEKILDCLVSGIVPIYAGAVDITEYVPKECFISLRDFNGYSELYEYLKEIKKDVYFSYLKKAEEYINSDLSDLFSGSKYAHYILMAISNKKEEFRPSKLAYKIFKYLY